MKREGYFLRDIQAVINGMFPEHPPLRRTRPPPKPDGRVTPYYLGAKRWVNDGDATLEAFRRRTDEQEALSDVPNDRKDD